ncbi:MAG: TonB-dependent receptor plug [Puniceicoccaceae bacterium 5H]|nr:MAG: TonB-dependent receptor plug [Puniceicoccaceae bacterium 5H]
MKKKASKRSQRRAANAVSKNLLVLFFAAHSVMAQDAADEEVFELSPFEVSTSESSGYMATSTLAGSRLNTELRDVSSAISVVTPEFMQDTGSDDLQDILVYTTNTEVAGLGGNFYGGGAGDTGYINKIAERPQSATRVRGLNEADLTRNYFLTEIGMDAYNTSRIDIQRGPNSILFGLGSPAGIINSTLKTPNMVTDQNMVEMKVDQYGTLRGVIDADQTLIKNTLGVRVALLDEKQKFRQDDKFEDDKRAYVVGRWTPKIADGIYTQFQVSFEKGEIDANRPRATPPMDMMSPWFDYTGQWTFSELIPREVPADVEPYLNNGVGGKWYDEVGVMFVDPNSGAAGGPNTPVAMRQRGGPQSAWSGWYGTDGLSGNLNNPLHVLNQKSYYEGTPTEQIIADYEAQGHTFSGFGSALWPGQSITDDSIFDFYEDTLSGPNDRQFENFDALNLAFAQTYLNKRVGIDVQYDRQNYESGHESLINESTYIAVDINEKLRDGTDNPNLGRPYVASTAAGGRSEVEREAFRATAFATFRFDDVLQEGVLTKILGEHTFTGVFSNQRAETFSRSYDLYRTDAEYYDRYRDGIGYESLILMHYLGDSVLGRDSLSGTHISGVDARQAPPSSFTALVHDPDSTDPVTNGWTYADMGVVQFGQDGVNLYTGATEGYDVTESKSFIWQSRFWEGTVVGLWGWRTDDYERYNKSNNLPRDEYNMVLPYSSEWNYDGVTPVTASEQRVSWGVVVHTPEELKQYLPSVINDVSVFYNKSNNFRPSEVAMDVYGNQLAAPSGETDEYGFAFAMLDERVNVRATWYETLQKNTGYSGVAPNFYWVRNAITRTLNGMMVESWTGHDREQRMPSSYVNDWMFGEGNWDETIASQPVPENWEDIPGILDQPLRMRASLDPDSPTYVAPYQEDPVNNSTIAPHITEAERNYRDAWFKARSDDEWFRPIDPRLRESMDWQRNEQGGSGIWQEVGAPSSMRFVNDLSSEGFELEVVVNPTDNWRIAFNMAQQKASRSNVMNDFEDFINVNLPLWQDGYSPDDTYDSLWDFNGYADIGHWGGDVPQTLGTHSIDYVYLPYLNAKQTEGKSVDEMREWRWNLVTNYTFVDGMFDGVNLGGAARWQDEGIIGYYPRYYEDAGVWINDLDNPIKSDAELNIDFWIGYTRELFDKVDWTIQLNVRNAFADDDLIPIRANPDGSVAEVRIPQERLWSLSSTFRF